MSLKKRMMALVMAGVMLLSVGGCGKSEKPSEKVENAPKKGEILGETLKYDTSVQVNNGEKIELTIWTDPEPQPFYQEIADKYHAIHENVTVKVVSQPWDDYWTKLPLALEAGNGPDLYRSHPSRFPNVKNYSYELPEDIFPAEEVKADFPIYDQTLFDGKLYSIPLGMTTGAGVYYNKKMWADAGLTEEDIPKTWAEFEEVGKKLVKKDDKGNITQYGFSVDHAFEGFIDTMNYSSNLAAFKEDGVTYNLDNEITYENLEMMKRWKDEFMMYSDGDAEDEFGHGQVAMIGHWNWVAGYFNATYPEIDWGFFLVPTKDGKQPAAYDRFDLEWTLSVSSKDEAKRAVAFDLLKFYACEQKSYLDHAVRIGCICANEKLQDDPKWDEQPNLKAIAEVADRLVYPGNVPVCEARNKAMRAAGSDIFINGKDPREVIPAVVKQLSEDAKKNNIVYRAEEDKYAHYDEMIK